MAWGWQEPVKSGWGETVSVVSRGGIGVLGSHGIDTLSPSSRTYLNGYFHHSTDQHPSLHVMYIAQAIVEQLWQPFPGRTKDYIAAPKPNGYQSLHSTLLLTPPTDSSSSSSSSKPVVLSYLELQVRTAAMHAAAEGGDAAHSGYKGRLERRQVSAHHQLGVHSGDGVPMVRWHVRLPYFVCFIHWCFCKQLQMRA